MTKAQLHAGNNAGPGQSASRRSSDMFAQADRHSRRVRMLKIAIPVIGVCAGGLFLAATVFRPRIDVNVSAQGVSLSDGRIVMAAPKLDGVTRDNKPYSMVAERAYQNVKTGEIELENISAGLPFTGDNTAALTASAGWYNSGTRKLKLSDGVVLKTTDGMTATLKSADIDINSRYLSTAEPVDITTAQARITADSMTVMDGGKVLVFDRKVKMTIDPSALDGAATSSKQ